MTWAKVALAELTTKIGSGATPKGGDSSYKDTGTPLIRSMNVHDGEFRSKGLAFIDDAQAGLLNNVTLRADDVLLNITGASVARVCTLPEAYTGGRVNQHVAIIRAKADRLLPKYLEHYLINPQTKAELLGIAGAGATREAITKASIETIEIPLPHLEEQKRIAAILDQADALRRLRARALDRLNALGQAIFHEMFGDIAQNTKNFPLGTVSDLTAGTQYGSSEKAGATGAFAMLRMNNLTYDGRMDLTSLKYVDLDERDVSKFTVRTGDMLFNRTNSPELVGKTAVYRGTTPLAFAGYLVRLRANKDGNTDYISAVLNSGYGKATLRGMCKSIIGMANINAKELQTIPIPLPPVALQEHFSERLANVQASRPMLEAAQKSVETLFTSLQHRAFRGEL